MQPDSRFITIYNGLELIPTVLFDLFISPRMKAIEWAKTTGQTPNLKVGYPGQHLVSLVTGMQGEKTGARGNDLIDGSEIKSCSRIDQVDECKDCKNKVLRIEDHCGKCKSKNIKRMNDSKWLFTIRSRNDLLTLTQKVKRIILVIADYPNFQEGLFDDLRFEIYEIWTNSNRCTKFVEIMTNYYENIYTTHLDKNPKKVPAPKNFWPDSYQFYLCNPIKIFSATVVSSINNPKIIINYYVEPTVDRNTLPSLNMPILKLHPREIQHLLDNVPIEILRENLPTNIHPNFSDDPLSILENCIDLNEKTKSFLPLREDTTFEIPSYERRSY